jgi:MFS family permease
MQKQDIQNAACDIVGESFWGFQAALMASATVLVIILRQFGAGRAMIGSITSIETCAYLFPQIFGLYVFRTMVRRKFDLILYHYVIIIPIPLLIGFMLFRSPVIAPVIVRSCILAFWAVYTISIGIVMAVWMDWIAGLFDITIRGTVMGLAFCGSAATGTAGGLVSGWVIGHLHSVASYGLLYIATTAISSIAMVPFCFINDPRKLDRDTAPPSIVAITAKFRESLLDGNFRSFLVGRIIATSGFCILPLVADYFSSPEGGAIAPGTLVSCGAAGAVGTALANLGLGRVGDRFGHRLGLMIGCGTQIAALVALILIPGEIGCLLVYFATGVCAGSSFLSHYNMVFETCPHGNRSAHITVANLVIGCFTVFTPVLAGVAAAHLGMHFVFYTSLALSVVAFAWLVTRVKEPRAAIDGMPVVN